MQFFNRTVSSEIIHIMVEELTAYINQCRGKQHCRSTGASYWGLHLIPADGIGCRDYILKMFLH